MRVLTWLATPMFRKNMLQFLVLLVLLANIAVSGPFRQLWRQLRTETETVHLSVSDVQGLSSPLLTMPQQTEPQARPTKAPTEVCYNCEESCLSRTLPGIKLRTAEPAVPMPKIHRYEMTTELEELLKQPVINHFHHGYIHNPSDLCKDDDVEILFLIDSRPEDVFRRREIRMDQLGLFKQISMFRNVDALFLMGTPPPDSYMAGVTQTMVDMEAKKYRDIIQVNFTDTQENAHYKTSTMFQWAVTHCRAYKYVIEIGSDVILEMKVIYALRYMGKRHENFVIGTLERMMSVADYPIKNVTFTQDYLPTFARRGLIGYPAKTARLVYEAMLRTPLVPMPDVYVTGLCAPRIGAELLEDRRFRFDIMSDDERGDVI